MKELNGYIVLLLALCGMAIPAHGQIYNPPQWPLWADASGDETRTNLGLGAGWLTNTNTPIFTQGSNPAVVLSPWITIGTNVGALQIASNAISGPGSGLNFVDNEIWGSWGFHNGIQFIGTNATTAAAISRTNLGLGAGWLTNANAPMPYSGAAPQGALLQADGAGGSAFVAAATDTRRLQADSVRASWGGVFSSSTNIESGFGTWSLPANSIARVEYMILFSMDDTNAQASAGFRFLERGDNGSQYMFRGFGMPLSGSATGIANSGDVAQIPVTPTGTSQTNRWVSGWAMFDTGTNPVDLSFGWTQATTTTNPTTLRAGSTISVQLIGQ